MSKRSRQRHRLERREAEGEKKLAAMLTALPTEQTRALDAVAEIMERKVGVDESRQPRFHPDPRTVFMSTFRWIRSCTANEPNADAPVTDWDTWYREFVLTEPFLVGVFKSAVQIDKNRGWTITGGRNQVAKFTKRVHSFESFPGYIGWRPHVEFCAQSFYSTQMGFVSEIGRESKNGPMLKLYSVDPCACQLTADIDYPLKYHSQEWELGDFVRGASMVRTDEAQLGYGYPAIAICYELAKIMVGIYSHYGQKLGSRTPDGILAGRFIDELQWRTALEARDEALNSNPGSYLNSIATLMSAGSDMPEFALTILSSLPDKFDIDVWTQILMRGYALAFGYPSSEFYPESAGVLGRGKEQEMQHRASTGKGGKDFSLTHQEKLQSVLPQAVEFMYDERDVTGEIEDAALSEAKARVITEVNKWVIKSGGVEQSIIPAERIIELAGKEGIIPEEWTPTEEDVTATDEDTSEQDVSERVYRAMREFPGEDIVRYEWPSKRTRIVKVARKFFVPKSISRQETPEEIRYRYNDALGALVAAVIAGTLTAREMARRHRALLREYAAQMYNAAGDAGDEEAAATIAAWLEEQNNHVDDFAQAAAEARDDKEKRDGLLTRLALWVGALVSLGVISAMQRNRDEEGEWRLGGTMAHCRTCAGLNGQVHPVSWFLSNGYRPREAGSMTLECKGYRCLCAIYSTKDGRQLA